MSVPSCEAAPENPMQQVHESAVAEGEPVMNGAPAATRVTQDEQAQTTLQRPTAAQPLQGAADLLDASVPVNRDDQGPPGVSDLREPPELSNGVVRRVDVGGSQRPYDPVDSASVSPLHATPTCQ